MWRFWKQGVALVAVALVAGLWSLSPSLAKGPGGGVPPGVVYFRHASPVHDLAMWQMDAAGTPSSRVPVGTWRDYGVPSYQRHANQRWFVYNLPVWLPAGEYQTFPNGRVAEGIWAGNEDGQEILLLSEPDIEVISETIWAADDASISFVGERWLVDETGQPTAVEAGLYKIDVAYDADGAVVGSVPGSLTFLADLSPQLRTGPAGYNGELAGHSWAPGRTSLTFGVRSWNTSPSYAEVYVVDLSLVSDPAVVPPAALRLLASGHGVGWPEWSPDGSRIGYVSSQGTVIYDLSRGRSKTLASTPNGSWGRTQWSPDGSYFVLCHWDNFYGYDAIYRFTASLTGKTELTAGLAPPDAPFLSVVLIPVGWRN